MERRRERERERESKTGVGPALRGGVKNTKSDARAREGTPLLHT